MKVLLLAPQPFFTERGTPIAVRALVEAMSRQGWFVDVLTFHEGLGVEYKNVRIIRIPSLSWITNIPPGFSFKKLVCDVLLLFKALKLAVSGDYQYIHAVEESVFIAEMIKNIYGIPYVYDMDSSMPEQIVEKKRFLSFLLPLLRWFESKAIRRAAVVVPVCDALAKVAQRSEGRRIIILRDPPAFSIKGKVNSTEQKKQLGLAGTCFMYIGNLEIYQGRDLLLNSFALAVKKGVKISLAVVGGTPPDVKKYQDMCTTLGIKDMVRFLGPKPVKEVGEFVAVADVLVSPRITGVNTPMKIYAYLNSGKPILATDIESHTQVLSNEMAVLEPAVPERFADGMLRLASDSDLRNKLVEKAARVALEKYSGKAFEKTVTEFCRLMESVTRG